MKFIKQRLRLFLVPMSIFVLALTACRAYFFIKYRDMYAETGAVDIAAAMLRGLRFDLSTAYTVAAPFIALLFIPLLTRRGRFIRSLLYILLLWFSALIFYNFIDIQYYDFTGRHLSYELSTAFGDAGVIVKIGLMRYLPEMLGLIVLLSVFVFSYLKAARRLLPEASTGGLIAKLSKDMPVLLAVVVLSAVFIRGGIQQKSLSPINAFTDEKVELGNLSLNGIFTTFHTVYRMKLHGNADESPLPALSEADRAEALALIHSEDEVWDKEYPLFRKYNYASPGPEHRPLNVVVIIMESWSSKFVGALGGSPSASPFFDELSNEGLLIRCFANGQRSFRGLAAILGSVPSYDTAHEALIYQSRMEPLGTVLRRYGYESVFIHGAPVSSERLDGLVKRLGIQGRISKEDFPVSKETDDGVWGIYDEFVFLRANEELKRMKGPFFAVFFSLSSHSPYSVPSKEFEHFDPSVPHYRFLNSMRYSDYALKRFFEQARKEPYFNNTLFVIIGDHAEGNSTRENFHSAYSIPCLFLNPGGGRIKPGIYKDVASQIDIAPSVLDILRIDAPFTAWGKSVFRPGPRRALLSWGGDMFLWVDKPYMLLSDLYSVKGLYDYSGNPAENIMGKPEAEAVALRMQKELLRQIGLSRELVTKNRLRPPD